MISVGIQSAGSGSSDNIKQEIYIECPYVPTNTAFALVINNLDSFKVSDKDIPTFKAVSFGLEPITYYIELIGLGKGIYGINGKVLAGSDLKVTNASATSKEISQLSSTQIIDLGYTGTNIVDSLNSQIPAILIQDQSLGYVIIKGTFENGIYQELLWIGQAGTYGGNGALQATLTDFKALSGSTAGSDETDQNNFSRTITVTPADLSGVGTIENQICEYINGLNYLKQDTDADVWVEYDPDAIAVVNPVDCVVSQWSEWSACTIDGKQSRTRTVVTPAANGGAFCPVLFEVRNCTYVAPVLLTQSYFYEGIHSRDTTNNGAGANKAWVDYYDQNNVLQRKYIGPVENGCQEVIASSIKKVYGCNTCVQQPDPIPDPIPDPPVNNNSGTYTLSSAPQGGCSVTYYDVNNNLATENIPEQDAGLSFTINVGSGGIQSDSCGFN